MELPANRPWVSSNSRYNMIVICFARLANSACKDPGNANQSKFAHR
jgi:hypothetical protein